MESGGRQRMGKTPQRGRERGWKSESAGVAAIFCGELKAVSAWESTRRIQWKRLLRENGVCRLRGATPWLQSQPSRTKFFRVVLAKKTQKEVSS